MQVRQSRRSGRAVAGVLAGTLALVGVGGTVAATGASAVPGFALQRLEGTDRYATAAQIALATFPTGTPVAVLARGDAFADALSANQLAGAKDAPILLTGSSSLPAVTATALRRLGVKEVVIVGGRTAVSASVQAVLDADYSVSRLSGDDRYDTAAAVTEAAMRTQGAVSVVNGLRTAFVGSGQSFPDVLAAGPVAYASGVPLILTRPDQLPGGSAALLAALEVQQVFVVGGTAAVSTVVEEAIARVTRSRPVRVAGLNRYETAAAIAELARVHFGFNRTHVELARGDQFADALAGGPHAGKHRAPILLVTPTELPAATRASLVRDGRTLVDGHLFGGVLAISRTVQVAAEAAGATPGDDTAPDPAVLSSPATATSTDSTSFTITGTAEPGAKVSVLRAGDRGPAGDTTAHPATGAFSSPVALLPGDNDFLVVVIDAAGNTSPDRLVPTITQAVDSTPPDAPVLTSPTMPTTTSTASYTITGTAEPGSTVRILLPGGLQEVASGPASLDDGRFSVTAPLEPGPNDFLVAASDAQGLLSRGTTVPTITSTALAP